MVVRALRRLQCAVEYVDGTAAVYPIPMPAALEFGRKTARGSASPNFAEQCYRVAWKSARAVRGEAVPDFLEFCDSLAGVPVATVVTGSTA